jgi:two-component system sensor histidine kinase CiaH
MFRSATFKLTMYYLAIIAVISISFSSALYHMALDDLAYGLQQQTRRISDNFPVFYDSPYLRSNAELAAGRDHLIGRLVLFNVFVLGAAGFASYALARRTLQPIEAAHKLQKRFTADVSHELRTPLTALKMEAEVALLDPNLSKTELRNVIGSSIEEAEKLTNLVNSLLRLGQLDDAEKSQLFTVFPIENALQSAILQVQAACLSQAVSVEITGTVDAHVNGDQATLIQLFVILLDNAIKYSPSNSVVQVNAATIQHMVQVSIRDHGIGIPKNDLEHVFERFYRADSARSASTTSGFGLGLSIAKLIADSHHATVSLTSAEGKGTTATLLIPQAVKPTPSQLKS